MKKTLAVLLALVSLLFSVTAFAEAAQPGATPSAGDAAAAAGSAAQADEPQLTTEYRWFVNRYRYTRGRTVTYYDNVYAYNHGEYYMTPFADVVPMDYIAIDEDGGYAVASIVLDITDAMRESLYGGDYGETAMFYGQYCERIRDKAGRVGFSGIHEGIDFKHEPGAKLHAILGGEVTRAGDSNGTVGVYNEEYDVTLLYLHCEEIEVRRGDKIEAGTVIAVEGDKNSGSAYTHVEMRNGRHTSSNAYRDTKVESACPYPVMEKALSVAESGRQPVTAAAVLAAQRIREEAEAKAAAAAAAAAEAQQEEQEQIVLVDELPGTQEGYGFEEQGESPAPQATLPPSNP
ncbi:MAG: M23 family metallopeptidase [Clostridia bacterium]|nr:M23 family metallopeptidase [Clostridia bacterium]